MVCRSWGIEGFEITAGQSLVQWPAAFIELIHALCMYGMAFVM
jgi:hypothetical protein